MNEIVKDSIFEEKVSKKINIENKYASLKRNFDIVLRRAMDIFISFLGLFFLSPAFLIIAVLIKRDSPGPVFYKGQRAGMNGRNFKIIKFRSMYERTDSYSGSKVTAQDDNRITKIGKILRDTKLNELPQLWNVLVGEMSLVGPRPEDPEIVRSWSEEVRNEILSVRPGITSPASVLYRNEETMLKSVNLMDRYLWDILPSKLRLDQLFVRNRTILTDLDIIFWTAIALVPRLNGFQIPEHLLYRGPLSLLMNRYVNWFVLDFFVSLFAVTLAGVLRRLSSPLDIGVERSAAIALVIALLFSLINTLRGINRIDWDRASPGEAFELAISAGFVTVLMFLVNFILPDELLLPQIVLVTSGMFAFFGFVIIRYRSRLITGLALRWTNMRGKKSDFIGEAVLVVGAGEAARLAIWLLQNGQIAQAFRIIGIVDDDPNKIGTRLDKLRVIGRIDNIPHLIKKHDVGIVVFAIEKITPTESDYILGLCRSTNTRVIMMPDVMDSLSSYFPREIDDQEKIVERVIRKNTTDHLTGVFTKQYFLYLLEKETVRSKRYHHPYSLILFRITYPWPDGATRSQKVTAQVLQTVARVSRAMVREIDLIGRYSEEQFIIFLPETSLEYARLVVDRLSNKLISTPIQTDRGLLNISVFVGVASQEKNMIDKKNLLMDVEFALERSCAGNN